MIETPSTGGSAGGPAAAGPPVERTAEGTQTTGRYIVVFGETGADPAALLRSAGLSNVANTRDFHGRQVELAEIYDAEATVFATLGMAVVSADPAQLGALGALQSDHGPRSSIISVSPELIHHVLPDLPSGYIRGYRDGVTDLSGRLGSISGSPGAGQIGEQPASFQEIGQPFQEVGQPFQDIGQPFQDIGQPFQDTDQFTWGLQATKVNTSPWSGRGVKVAVLDTGVDLTHPDFAGRNITAQSFIKGEPAQDVHGHGTHCIGTACGPKAPSTGPRYGIAYEADIYAGKVLDNNGSGNDGGILAGIDWAVTNGYAVISMSLGADVASAHPPYTAAGARALDQGSLIIAAAGNNADRRQGNYGFVGVPANSPFVMAVAALDEQLHTAYFSARSLQARGGQIDVAGPGWLVHSSWPMPERYRSISGTSMAAPYASGVAALWAEATGYRGRELWATMVQESQRLGAPSVDVGSGLVIAPQ